MRTETYRNKLKARVLDGVRGEIVRRIIDVIGKREWNATHIRKATGIDLEASDLWKLKEGDTTTLSDNRLLLLGERLGLRFTLTVH